MSKRIIRRRGRLRVLLALVAVLALGAWSGDRLLKSKGHPGLLRFGKQLVRNYPKSFEVEPPLLSIKVDRSELDRLQAVVEAARERGVIMPEGNDYVSAELSSGGATFKARIRIKGKMTDHVKGDKWSFRVIAKKDGGFMGMKRFSLQHPGTRNYLYEWLHQHLMRGEGIVALRYGFLRLEFNGEDRGVYAYEEHFDPGLLEANDRVKGPLFRFDPALFWQHRLNEMNARRFDEPFAFEQAAAIDAYGTGDLEKDPAARAHFEEAVALMNAYRDGSRPLSEVFHVDRVARRLALLDLLGGYRSLDWSDAKFYYDPVLHRVEPVAYESFGGYRIKGIAGAGRWTGDGRVQPDVYSAWFNDEAVFRAYVGHLERFARSSYLDSAFAALAGGLDTASATLYGEFPYKELDRGIYTHNQQAIRQVLDVPKGFHAYRNGSLGDTLTIAIVPIGSLPIEVHGLVGTDGSSIRPLTGAVVPIRRPGSTGVPVFQRFLISDTAMLGNDLQLEYSVLGASVRKRLEVFPFALIDAAAIGAVPPTVHAPLTAFPFLRIDEGERRIVFAPGQWTITEDLVIPEGYSVQGASPLLIDLRNAARIIGRSPIALAGSEDDPVVVRSSDASGGGIFLLAQGQRNTWRHVRCEGFGPAAGPGGAGIVLQETTLDLRHCTLAEVRDRDLLLAVRSSLRIEGGEVFGGRDQFTMAFSDGHIASVSIGGAGDDALVLRGGSVKLTDVEVTGAKGCGVKVNTMGALHAEGLRLSSAGKGIEVEEAAAVELRSSVIRSGKVGADIRAAEMRYGGSRVTLDGVDITTEALPLRVGKGNQVLRDGTAVPVNANTGSE